MPKYIPIPPPDELQKEFPLTLKQKKFIESSRQTVRDILDGCDDRLLVIVGPCSIHDTTAALEYATNLRELAQKTQDTLFILQRTYVEKSRTAKGWKGLLYDPHLDGSCDIIEGITTTRKLLLSLTSLEMPAAAEILDPFGSSYYSDMLTWACIGARTATSQTHRGLASLQSFPVAIKNTIDGNIANAVHGVEIVSSPHRILGLSPSGKVCIIETSGNPDAHIVLRGSETRPNYTFDDIQDALKLLSAHHLPARVMIDCSHGNSQRQPKNQIEVLQAVLELRNNGHHDIRGIILESHLQGGRQSLTEHFKNLHYGMSITDGCLSWESTQHLLLEEVNKIRLSSMSSKYQTKLSFHQEASIT